MRSRRARTVATISMLVITLFAGALGMAPNALAARPMVTLTFDDRPRQSADGLSVKGVTFGFQLGNASSSDAYYAAVGPGLTGFTADPSLEGNADGQLTMTFAGAIDHLQFGFAVNSIQPLTSAVTVTLLRPNGKVLEVVSAPATPSPFYAAGQVTYQGDRKFKSAVVTFHDSATRFVIDNLTFPQIER